MSAQLKESSYLLPWGDYRKAGQDRLEMQRRGLVTQVVGMLIEGAGPESSIGDMCEIYSTPGALPVKAEVVGFRNDAVLLMSLGAVHGIRPGSVIISRGKAEEVGVGASLLGRVIDALGDPLDDGPPIRLKEKVPLHADPINPMYRRAIETPLDLGIQAVNGLLTIGRGQRIGIFSGSGVGKSTLLGMMARYTSADINVVALIGERGREVVAFLKKELGTEGLARSVVVVATGDQPPLMRIRAAHYALAVAEYFRSKDKDVLLLMDSVTRLAMAQREVGLTRGEPPTSKGYPPSTFMLLPRLLERAGRDQGAGSITGLFTVLMEADDIHDPIVDAVRGILDGHIVLSRGLADSNHYPAIDVLGSLSRLMSDLATDKHKKEAGMLRDMLATYTRAEDMINIGAYVPGSNPKIDRAVALIDPIRNYLRQPVQVRFSLEESIRNLEALFASKY
ncbi:MAG: FliI/YscN family ATPase [Magnetococcus sp. DMHC-6]